MFLELEWQRSLPGQGKRHPAVTGGPGAGGLELQ